MIRKHGFVQGSLNREDEAAGRLVLSITAEVKEAKKRLDMAIDQAATAAAKRAELDDAAMVRGKVFEIICPDGVRRVRHRGASQEDMRRRLQPGYSIAGEVFGANADDTGGFVSVPGAPSMLKALLEANGDDLIAFLAERGIISSDKQTVVILPNNNRELQ